MLKRTEAKQSFFMDADCICERLVTQDSFYRKLKELVISLFSDEQFADMYCHRITKGLLYRSEC
jgi:hypothetical protein